MTDPTATGPQQPQEDTVTHRSDAEATIIVTRDTLAQTEGKSVPTDVSIANSTRAQAVATAAVAQAVLALADAITEEPRR